MLKKRIIPCLDIKDGRVVKGIQFLQLKDAGNPVELASFYSKNGADELVFLDISATLEKRKTLAEMVTQLAKEINIPFTVGGGIQSVEDAKLLEETGCFAIVLEKIPAHLAKKVAESVSIPIIGIGAGNGVDGQVLVVHDMLGINNEFNPRFLRKYNNLYEEMMTSFSRYIEDVKSGSFPSEDEQY